MHKHHSFEEKLKYMKLIDEGYPIRQLSRETKVARTRLYIWRKRYFYYGQEGLKRKVPHHVSESSESLSRSKGCPSKRDWAEAILEPRRKHRLELLLKIRRMAKSTFYYHVSQLSEPDKYDVIKGRIYSIYEHHKGRYGYRRVAIQLKNEGFPINHKTVQSLMVDMGLKAKIKRVKYLRDLYSIRIRDGIISIRCIKIS